MLDENSMFKDRHILCVTIQYLGRRCILITSSVHCSENVYTSSGRRFIGTTSSVPWLMVTASSER